jgi:hypothetical protein
MHSKAQSDASASNQLMSHFLYKSSERDGFAIGRRLTGGLPDVGTDRLFRRNLIRD